MIIFFVKLSGDVMMISVYITYYTLYIKPSILGCFHLSDSGQYCCENEHVDTFGKLISICFSLISEVGLLNIWSENIFRFMFVDTVASFLLFLGLWVMSSRIPQQTNLVVYVWFITFLVCII